MKSLMLIPNSKKLKKSGKPKCLIKTRNSYLTLKSHTIISISQIQQHWMIHYQNLWSKRKLPCMKGITNRLRCYFKICTKSFARNNLVFINLMMRLKCWSPLLKDQIAVWKSFWNNKKIQEIIYLLTNSKTYSGAPLLSKILKFCKHFKNLLLKNIVHSLTVNCKLPKLKICLRIGNRCIKM